MIKIYFAGSIRGGRGLAGKYREIIDMLKKHGQVFTEHVGDDIAIDRDNVGLTDREIHDRDLEWIRQSDLMVAEVTIPSLGVGYEIARAIDLQKSVLCLVDRDSAPGLSAMISGCSDLRIIEYASVDEAEIILKEFIAENQESMKA